MRLFVIGPAAAACLMAGDAAAQALQDRYDPPTPAAATAYALRGSQTTMLTWTGKVEPLRGAEDPSEGLRGPVPLDTGTGQAVRNANPARYAGHPFPAAVQAPAAPPAVRAPPTPAGAPARLPASLHDRVAAAPPPETRPPQIQAPRTQALQTPAPQPQVQQAQGQPPTDLAGAAPGGQSPHFYSLHREYGLTPDPPPPVQPSVLAFSPAVAQAMLDNKDDSAPIDLAGQDQAQVAPPPRLRNANGTAASSGNQTSTTNADGATSTTYNFKN